MHKTTSRKHAHNNHHQYDLYADLEKIKHAFSDTADDLKGKTAQVWFESLDGIKDRSTKVGEGIKGYTSEKPFKSLLLAATLGAVIGYLSHK